MVRIAVFDWIDLTDIHHHPQYKQRCAPAWGHHQNDPNDQSVFLGVTTKLVDLWTYEMRDWTLLLQSRILGSLGKDEDCDVQPVSVSLFFSCCKVVLIIRNLSLNKTNINICWRSQVMFWIHCERNTTYETR